MQPLGASAVLATTAVSIAKDQCTSAATLEADGCSVRTGSHDERAFKAVCTKHLANRSIPQLRFESTVAMTSPEVRNRILNEEFDRAGVTK